jgi:ADP-dependent NAD(P)H-hydrate dehydratase / NAD(P)H-hydrate epimerase
MSDRVVDDSLVTAWVRAPGPKDHKYSRGVLGVLTGSLEYPGAALLGVNAALRTGIGMVRYLGPHELHEMVLVAHPEVVITEGPLDALLIGSGVPEPASPGTEASIKEWAKTSIPVVLDAGGLGYAELFGQHTILTPHSGELKKLVTRLGLAPGDTDLETARALARHLGHTVLLKGSTTFVVDCEGSTLSVPRATPWLATAGTGDALGGIMGALLAPAAKQVLSATQLSEVAAAAALIHPKAADAASKHAGQGASGGGPITASDLCAQIPAVVAGFIGS